MKVLELLSMLFRRLNGLVNHVLVLRQDLLVLAYRHSVFVGLSLKRHYINRSILNRVKIWGILGLYGCSSLGLCLTSPEPAILKIL